MAGTAVSTRWFAPCPKGLEYLLVDELKALGASEAREQLAGVRFEGDATLGYRACLWSRLASRILLPVAEFECADAAQLYAGAMGVDWSAHLGPGATFAVDAHGRATGLDHSQFVALKVKDAIVDQARARDGQRPDVDRENPDVRINVVLRRDRAVLSIDFAGGALFHRGYRRGQGEAPLKENLACAMLLRARWPEVHAAGGPLVDPMCGSGTLLIEGALMAGDVAPGLQRAHHGFTGWRGFDAAAWEALLAEARARATAGLRALAPTFHGFDRNAAVLGAAKSNAQAAGVAGFIQLAHRPVAALEPPPHAAPGLVIVNPPYGERMGEIEALRGTYRELGDALKRGFAGWRAALITNHEELGRATGLRAERSYTLFNGALECRLLCFDAIGAAREQPSREPKPLSDGAQALRNRLLKNIRHLKSWRQREGVSCWRAYDADLPEYSAAIDVYDGWLHLQEYEAPKDIPQDIARRRFGEIVRVAGEVFEVPRERIAIKQRRVQTRDDRYGRQAERAEVLEVTEDGLAFEVNLFDYLDTGLFLDHRPMRARLRQMARGTRFLNLFCYTATASVHAAAGGARSTTSVDLSNTYLEWAGRNLARNGFTGAAHRLVQADTIAWLEACRESFDLVFVDPPTFSNSKRAEDFDVQRDHVRLLQLCGERLAPDGVIVFSNNFRRFRLDAGALSGFEVRDITRATIPPDFARDPKIHHAFELRLR
jgi:23S rRNA (guanine2445-N2)-methyltransferase / 23S rRNA (guanine2069-N7)-methyltransferase